MLVVDNVDSFTFTLVDYLRQLGAEVDVVRSTDLTVEKALTRGAGGILISPGPGRPEQAGISVALAKACVERRHPLLGVCLGHQAIALAAAGQVGRSLPMHGKTDAIRHDGTGLFAGLPTPLTVTRYHSLTVDELAPELVANAWSDDGTIQGIRHAEAPVHGVQFHPESVASEHGLALLANFLAECSHTGA